MQPLYDDTKKGLTKEDLKEIRRATNVVFYHRLTGYTVSGQIDGIAFNYDDKKLSGTLLDLPVDSYFQSFENYYPNSNQWEAITVLLYVDTDPIWQTIRDSFRVGDQFVLEWMQGAGNTETLAEYNIVSDWLRLYVVRKNKVLAYEVDRRTAKKNSSARMIKAL